VSGAHSLSLRAVARAVLIGAVALAGLAGPAVRAIAQDAPTAAEAPGEMIDAIVFSGLDHSEPGDLRAHMQTAPGRPFSQALFDADVVALRNAGFFVRRYTFTNGRLVLTVAEALRAVEFTGLKFAQPGDLQALMKTRPGRPFNRTLFNEDVVELGRNGFFVGEITHAAGRLLLAIDERNLRHRGQSGAAAVRGRRPHP
jgi:outer membrane protein assembly factor BamA